MTDPRATADDLFAALFAGQTDGADSSPGVASIAEAASAAVPAHPVAPLTPASPSFPTRRELREAERRQTAGGRRDSRGAQTRPVSHRADAAAHAGAPAESAASSAFSLPLTSAPTSAPAWSVPARQVPPAFDRRAARPASAVVAAPAYTDPRAKLSARKPVKALVTMTAVAGLVISAGLPAYAFSQPSSTSTSASSSAGSALAVSSDATAIDADRDEFTATSTTDLAAQRSNAVRDANWQAYQTSGAREAGDDYPYFSELSLNQGGGLSPLNYFYRECVDFVAWKLNEDAGSTSAPYLMDWSYLTPLGGNAYQWKANWETHGWTVSTTPKKGSVAWFGGHVGYVAAVNDDGTVLIQEYNWQNDHLYSTRTIPATDVLDYLYAPPVPDASE